MAKARRESGSKGSPRAGSTAGSGSTSAPGDAARRVAWLGLVAVWAFLILSLTGFDPGDAPGFGVYPPNDPTENPAGPVGAALAHWSYRMLGYPAWVLILGLGPVLLLPVFKRRIGQPVLRSIGLLVLTGALCGINGLIVPGLSPMPGLAGGVLGDVIATELATRFNVVGSMVWLILLVAVGAVVTLDRYLVVVPMWIWQRLSPAAMGAGQAAGAAAAGTGTAARRAGSGLIAGLGSMLRGRTPIRVRIDDLDGKPSLDRAQHSRAAARARSDQPTGEEGIEPFPDPDLETTGPGEDDQGDDDEQAVAAPVIAGDDAEEDDELPGAPQVFDRASLQEKISKLPTRFASANRTAATDDDLRDLQNAVDLKGYRFPGLDLLEEPEEGFSERLEEMVRGQAEALESALGEYRIDGEVVGIESGPVITQFDVRLAPGTKVSRLQAVSADIARALKAVNVRIVANQAGRDTVGVEVPNPRKEKVRLKELMSNRERFCEMKLPMFLGKDAAGDPLIADLTTMPHVLIAGTTGSGKSVCMNTIIMSFLYTRKPNELKLVLVDPKMVEMSQFKDIPHLMSPVVTEMSKAAAILEWASNKMDERYELLAEAGVRDIASYNTLTWEELKEAFGPKTPQEEARIPRRLPYMVFVIDELADLMMTNKEVEGSIIRIAQKARAVGIHLILATQRPQANVVTGLIKSNMPCRITFKVASGMDSRIVLDQKGGELLLGQGDMLFLSPSSHKLYRAQGTLVDDREIRRVVRFLRDVAEPSFERQLVQLRSGDPDEERLIETENNSSASLKAAQEDPLFDRAVEIVLETKRGSVSLLQRRLAIGYTRASRLIDLMGIAGIISEHKGSVARDVLITPAEWEAIKQLATEQAAAQGIQGELFSAYPGSTEQDPIAAESDREVRPQNDSESFEPCPPWESPTSDTDTSDAEDDTDQDAPVSDALDVIDEDEDGSEDEQELDEDSDEPWELDDAEEDEDSELDDEDEDEDEAEDGDEESWTEEDEEDDELDDEDDWEEEDDGDEEEPEEDDEDVDEEGDEDEAGEEPDPNENRAASPRSGAARSRGNSAGPGSAKPSRDGS